MKNNILKDRKLLHKAIYNCTLCKDRGYYVERVQPKWDSSKVHKPTHKWGMLIGQSPGIHELERARELEKSRTIDKSKDLQEHTPTAFVGDAGMRLKQWLIDSGFTKEQILTQFLKTSITKCFPGRDKRNRDRKPTKKEIQLCSSFLNEQIRLAKPTVLLPMGKVAINWFFPKVEKLEQVIGKKLLWSGNNKTYAVVCLPHSSNASGWWKKESNKPLLQQAKQLLSELRISSCP